MSSSFSGKKDLPIPFSIHFLTVEIEITKRISDFFMSLFDLSPVFNVPPPYFRQQLTGGDEEPDLTLLSVVAGCVENCMTAIKVAPSQTEQVRPSQSDQDDLVTAGTFRGFDKL